MSGLYFEEFNVGQKIKTGERTIADKDIMTFADLSGEIYVAQVESVFNVDTEAVCASVRS